MKEIIETVCPFRVYRDHLGRENDSIILAREFLRRQKQSLRQRQASLKAAKQELDQDLLKQQLRPVSLIKVSGCVTTLRKKATIHQATTMLATSKVLFPPANPWYWWNRTFLEMASMVVTWWRMAFFAKCKVIKRTVGLVNTVLELRTKGLGFIPAARYV